MPFSLTLTIGLPPQTCPSTSVEPVAATTSPSNGDVIWIPKTDDEPTSTRSSTRHADEVGDFSAPIAFDPDTLNKCVPHVRSLRVARIVLDASVAMFDVPSTIRPDTCTGLP